MHWRKITIDKVVYKYYIGTGSAVILNTLTHKKIIVGLDKITGMSFPEIERAQWKRYFSVTPVMIAKYIKKNKA